MAAGNSRGNASRGSGAIRHQSPWGFEHHLPAYCCAGVLFPLALSEEGDVCGDRLCVTVGPPSVLGPAAPGPTTFSPGRS